MHITYKTTALKKSHIPQFDSASESNITKEDKPFCRVMHSGIEYILFQTKDQVLKMTTSNYHGCGWYQTFGQPNLIPKVILD